MRRSLVDTIEREADLTVCGQAEDAVEALAAIVSLRPDTVKSASRSMVSTRLRRIKAWSSITKTLIFIPLFVAGLVAFTTLPVGTGATCRRVH